MHGLVLDGVRAVTYRTDLDDPRVVEPSDVVVRVGRAGLCGSDLHPYEGREEVGFGVVPGHEVVGEVVAVGAQVGAVHRGDRVLVPFTTSCGRCAPCRRGLSSRCETGALFGYGDPAGRRPPLHGGQAELLRVPLAAATLVPAPAGVSDVDALLLTDNFPTGWFAAERADFRAGETVAVVGLGSVGLCSVAAARALGAGRIVAVDTVADRRERAAELGAIALAPDEAAAEAGIAAAVVEAAGSPAAQGLGLSLLRPGGTLSVIAVQTDPAFGFSPVQAYDANVTVRVGRAPVRSLLQRLLPEIVAGTIGVPGDLVLTHPDVALADGPEAYRRFAAREPGLVKVAFVP